MFVFMKRHDAGIVHFRLLLWAMQMSCCAKWKRADMQHVQALVRTQKYWRACVLAALTRL